MTLTVEAQGTVLVARDSYRPTALKRRLASSRGAIRVFTGASRRRLIELMARLNVAHVRTSFLTLTFSSVPTAQEAKRAFKAFTMRLRRKFPAMSAIWRMEFQARGSAHFHLIAFNMPYWSQRAIQASWEGCTHERRSIVHVKLLRGGKRQAMHYVAKYLAKKDTAVGGASLDNALYRHVDEDTGEITECSRDGDPGRFWGWLNRNGLPFDVRRQLLIDDDDLIKRLWFTMSAMSHGLAGQSLHAARFYGTCCYDLAEECAQQAQKLFYDITHVDGDKIRWYEVYHKALF